MTEIKTDQPRPYLDVLDKEFEEDVRKEHNKENPLIVHEDTLAIASMLGSVKLSTINRLIAEGLVNLVKVVRTRQKP